MGSVLREDPMLETIYSRVSKIRVIKENPSWAAADRAFP
jgi:hypothetical protein